MRAWGVSYTLNRFIDEHGNLLPSVGGTIVPRSEFRARNLEGGFFPPAAILIRAAVCQQVGVFDTTLTSEEDLDLWLRMSERYEFEGIAEPLARYRVYPDTMSTNAGRMHANRVRILTKYFGPPEGDHQTWSSRETPGLRFCLRESTAYGYVAQCEPDVGWRYLAQAVSTWPDLLTTPGYLLRAGPGRPTPWLSRRRPKCWTSRANGAEMLGRLTTLFAVRPFCRWRPSAGQRLVTPTWPWECSATRRGIGTQPGSTFCRRFDTTPGCSPDRSCAGCRNCALGSSTVSRLKSIERLERHSGI